MPYGIIDRSYYDAAEKGRQDAQNAQTNALMNRGRALDVQQGEYVNSLMRNPETNPEQFARAGRSDIANSLLNIRGDPNAAAKEFATQMTTAIRYAKGSKNPKALIEQNFPFLVQAFGPQWATATDEQVRAELDGAEAKFGSQAGIAPQQPKAPNLINAVGPDGNPIRAEDGPGVRPYVAPDKPTPRFRPMSPAELQAAGFPAGTTAQVNDSTGQIQVLTQPGSAGKLTEGERGAANYLGRMEAAEKLLDANYVPTIPTYMAAKKVMSGGAVSSSLANKFLSPADQKYYQAASDWVRAKLRKESGAAIGVDEMENEIKTYFPMPGDGPEVLAQKAQARAQAVEGMRGMSGRANDAGGQRLTPEQASQLPPGTKFVGMDGVERVKR